MNLSSSVLHTKLSISAKMIREREIAGENLGVAPEFAHQGYICVHYLQGLIFIELCLARG